MGSFVRWFSSLSKWGKPIVVLPFVAAALFALSAVGQGKNSSTAASTVGAIGWWGFVLTVLTLLVLIVAAVVRRWRGNVAPAR
jgi:hypothetical protein